MIINDLEQFITEALATIDVAKQNATNLRNTLTQGYAKQWDEEIRPKLLHYSRLLNKLEKTNNPNPISAKLGIDYFNTSKQYINSAAGYNIITSHCNIYLGGRPCGLDLYNTFNDMTLPSINLFIEMWNDNLQQTIETNVETVILTTLKERCEKVNQETKELKNKINIMEDNKNEKI